MRTAEHACLEHLRPSWVLLSGMPYQYCAVCGRMFFLRRMDGDLSNIEDLVEGGGRHFQIVGRRYLRRTH